MSQSFNEVLQGIHGLESINSKEWSLLAAAMNGKRKEMNDAVKATFRVGDKVGFATKWGQAVTGTIRKINRKNIVLKADVTSVVWTVNPSLLRMIG